MTVAIVHYHLHRGGVRTVIHAQSRALAADGVKHVVLSGSAPTEDERAPVIHLPALNYVERDDSPAPEELLAALDREATRALGAPPDLWHFHNHSLGKNRAVTGVAGLLAERGSRLVLQIHDFASDGRPGNFEYLAGCTTVYPVANHVHYAFINSRDRRFLVNSGLPETHCHLLPNAVTPPARPPGREPADPPTVLYPVRGIRRKNLGELCLLSALAPTGTRFAVSLAPENPQWRPVYDRWKAFAADLGLPVQFGVVGHVAPAPGLDPTFANWLACSTHLVTTSIAEGFGLAFLEPVGLGLPLLGRDLPDITCDFKEHEINLGTLYERLPIPLAWIDPDELREELREALAGSYRSYQREFTPDLLARAFESLTAGGSVDFGNLPEKIQEQVIVRAHASPEALPTTGWLAAALQTRQAGSPVEAIAAFSPDAYRAHLSSLYQAAVSSDASEVTYHPRTSILDQFLKPERFHFLRT